MAEKFEIYGGVITIKNPNGNCISLKMADVNKVCISYSPEVHSNHYIENILRGPSFYDGYRTYIHRLHGNEKFETVGDFYKSLINYRKNPKYLEAEKVYNDAYDKYNKFTKKIVKHDEERNSMFLSRLFFKSWGAERAHLVLQQGTFHSRMLDAEYDRDKAKQRVIDFLTKEHITNRTSEVTLTSISYVTIYTTNGDSYHIEYQNVLSGDDKLRGTTTEDRYGTQSKSEYDELMKEWGGYKYE